MAKIYSFKEYHQLNEADIYGLRKGDIGKSFNLLKGMYGNYNKIRAAMAANKKTVAYMNANKGAEFSTGAAEFISYKIAESKYKTDPDTNPQPEPDRYVEAILNDFSRVEQTIRYLYAFKGKEASENAGKLTTEWFKGTVVNSIPEPTTTSSTLSAPAPTVTAQPTEDVKTKAGIYWSILLSTPKYLSNPSKVYNRINMAVKALQNKSDPMIEELEDGDLKTEIKVTRLNPPPVPVVYTAADHSRVSKARRGSFQI